MNRPFSPSERTVESQRRAADPAASAWVSANAGSGKTTVLTNRVIRLLLSGVEPARILCLTYTKAAAANMSNRIFGQLAGFATMPEAELVAALEKIGEGEVDAELLTRARRLFAEALDTPGGLKLLTIHAFCERVLHQFPFEANVPAGFTVMEERLAAEAVARARADVLQEAALRPNGPIGRALSTIIALTNDAAFETALDAVLREREILADLLASESAQNAIAGRLETLIGVDREETVEAVDREIVTGGIGRARWADFAQWLEAGSANDQKRAACFRRAIAAEDNDQTRHALFELCFNTKEERRSAKDLLTKTSRESRPDLAAELEAEQERICALRTRRHRALVLQRSLALVTIGGAVLAGYEAEKSRRGALDFADLITKTARLLNRTSSAWVLFKLDGGVDHVLVDEAQDTAPEQWAILQQLTSEFIAGEGARDQVRTVFAVGDEKQSIYGFQGAAPEKFDEMRRLYAAGHRDAGRDFHDIRLVQSFRSAGDVLAGVDAIFDQPHARAGLHSDEAAPRHETARPQAGGRVELWPLATVTKAQTDTLAWDAPFDELAAEHPVPVLAQRIARTVAGWLSGRDPFGEGGTAKPGDILVLVRSRGPLFEAILRALKAADVPVAGADRLDVGAHIAVLDLLALGDALLVSSDDLSLACALKSPIFSLSDDDLIALAPNREGSLRDAISARARDDLVLHGVAERLDAWEVEARTRAPFEFFAAVLGRDGGRARFRARMGSVADDVLDEFLRLALDFEAAEPPTLAGFLAWMRAAPFEIKRDLDTGGSEVRVMTVHGAKGLEAKRVILADVGELPNARHDGPIFRMREPGASENLPPLLVWSTKAKEDPDCVAEARAAMAARAAGEHKRLYYVALTRAEERLVLAGHARAGSTTVSPLSWYGLAQSAFQSIAAEVDLPELGGTAYAFRTGTGPLGTEAAPAPSVAPPAAMPDWARTRIAQASGATIVRPSAALPRAPSGQNTRAKLGARRRGTLIHRLIERLPALAPEQRAEAARRYLEAAAGHAPGEHDDIVAEVLGLLADPAIAPFLTGRGRSEAPIAGEIVRADGRRIEVHGRVDRLIDDGATVTIVDFKTDQTPPEVADESQVAQLALYRAVLARVFAGRTIRAGLLWTAARQFHEVDETAMDAMLDRILGGAAVP